MAGKSPLTATQVQKTALRVLAGGADRGGADRARAILLTLAGWTGARIAERAHWLTVAWLPEYAPERNAIEGVRGNLKAHLPAHQTFTNPDRLTHAIHNAVSASISEQIRHPLGNRRNPA